MHDRAVLAIKDFVQFPPIASATKCTGLKSCLYLALHITFFGFLWRSEKSMKRNETYQTHTNQADQSNDLDSSMQSLRRMCLDTKKNMNEEAIWLDGFSSEARRSDIILELGFNLVLQN